MITQYFLARAVACALALFAQPLLAQSPRDELTLTPSYLAEEPAAPPPDAGGDDSVALAKKLSNPVASLISVPLQFNYDEGFGPKDAYKLTLNVQPVIPISLNDDWNLIIRTIVPVVYQDSLADGIDSRFGMGDGAELLLLAQGADCRRLDLGDRPGLPLADRDR